MNSKHHKLWLWLPIFLLILMATMSFSVTLGAANINWQLVWQIIFSKIPWLSDWVDVTWSDSAETIVWDIRMPRVLLGALVGAALALAGAIYQGVLRNPLADPFILGVSSGASFGASLVMVFGWQLMLLGRFTLPAVAFVSGFVSLLIVYFLSRVNHKVRLETIILAGVVVQSFVGACLSLVLSLSNEQLQTIVFWMMGSLALTDWSYNQIIFPIILMVGVLSLFFVKELNMLGLGEEVAHHSGVSVQRTRFVLLVLASIITGAAVSVSGAIGFVGLVVPHIIRLLFGADYRVILPLSIVGGAIFLVGADAFSRTILAPREIPLGVITAFLGAPFFGYLLRRAKRGYF
ncbi:FecCD family ABC transporter permease [Tenuibacillus multivorans]|uniref:Iron complex transport system permease protein n=1 Tax=Tenuibacillus multivorans TaxID=237069 RepID=A0A1H0B878_9BACI|nr:iron ABC transporter permease [Tenuibacillus multivorans]GEL78604.1 corrinoid ABC transporter permease [Tenuibacillus multivorans]SDN41870.1 iron complex transport system permease protein [Tenuibacillus multivorans]